jgi:hypothetical protein
MRYSFYYSCLALVSAAYLISSPAELRPASAVTPTIAVAPDTTSFPATYATALPSLRPEQWEKDYARYQKFLTPQINRTQIGMSFLVDGVHIWRCQPSASPHAQLDTTTRIQDPARLMGAWHSVVNRVVTHIDSFSVKDQKFYRRASVFNRPDNLALQMTAQKFTMASDAPKGQRLTKKYALVNQRYLLVQGAVSQIGLDAAGRLILHNAAVTERKVPGQYLTYQTVVWQAILAKD